MKSSEIRQKFIDFFISKGHTYAENSPVVPQNDPTLLFVNAGMNQFKDVFLGTGKRAYTRAVNSQPCIRVSGKHNDLEEVGLDTHHLTLFEMLGNWSFGDYYKKEAITWAWELLTEIYHLPKNKLYATVHISDQESADLWRTYTDIQPDHILNFDKENFWEMAETGPCGPCSEIHIDRGPKTCTKSHKKDHICQVNGDCGRYIELWNLVFMQYNRINSTTMEELPQKHVDTGAGLERITAYLQETTSNYETDLLQPIIRQIEELTDIPYENSIKGMPHRVMADHIRTLTFAIADNVVPSNEGRGYVLRRLLRRGLRYAKKLNIQEPILHKLADTVIKTMGNFYTHLPKRSSFIKNIIKSEEESFLKTLESGMILFDQYANQAKQQNTNIISGINAFKLYDTYGFPIDLTEIMAKEQNLTIDLETFKCELEKQRTKSRQNIKLHHADDERLSRGGEARIVTNETDRLQLARHHSATHLLQASLRSILGDHVYQAGSCVETTYLRFDFSHFQALSEETLLKIETLVNEAIQQDIPVYAYETDLESAKTDGALALFGEKYADKVRVIKIGDFSMELCGGNHVGHTGEIEQFKIISESAISAGTRRIVAIAGAQNIKNHLQSQAQKEISAIQTKHTQLKQLEEQIINLKGSLKPTENFEQLENLTPEELSQKYNRLLDCIKESEKMIKQLNQKHATNYLTQIKADIKKYQNSNDAILIHNITEFDCDAITLKFLAEQIEKHEPKILIILASTQNEKGILMIKTNEEFTKKHQLSALNLVKKITAITGGGGGGTSAFAQAGGLNPQKIADAFKDLCPEF